MTTRSDEGWEARMAEKARLRAMNEEPPPGELPNRSSWPVPEWVQGASARDALLWYIAEGWRRIYGTQPEVLFDHDFGYHVLSDGQWQLTFVNLQEFPEERKP